MSLARSVLAPSDFPDAELEKWWPLFGVESVSPKIADAICTLYNDAPYRTFVNDNEEAAKVFTELYEKFEVNHVFKDAYRAALFTNVVLLLPDWKEKIIRVLTPDYFRVVGNEELWIALGSGGYTNTEFLVFSKEYIKTVDHSGKLKNSEPNPYGRIPGVLLKLNRSNDVYGSGISEAAEISAWSNFIRFISTRVGVFQSFSVGLSVNLDIETGTRIGPGYILAGDNKGGEPGQNPSFDYKTPSGKFKELEEYRQQVIRSFERNTGLPGFLVDEGAGQPPTGAALQVLERSLNDRRKNDTYALLKAEKDLAELFSVMIKVKENRDLVAKDFSTSYAESQTFSDPSSSLDYDVKLMNQGLTSPSSLVLKYLNLRMSDEEADALIEKNKKFFSSTSQLQSTVGGVTVLEKLITDYEAGLISRDAAVNYTMKLYNFDNATAQSFFTVKPL